MKITRSNVSKLRHLAEKNNIKIEWINQSAVRISFPSGKKLYAYSDYGLNLVTNYIKRGWV